MAFIHFSHGDRSFQMVKGNVEPVKTAKSTTVSPPQYCFTGYGGVQQGGEKLCKFIDLLFKLNVGEGPWHPLIILIFDESHILTNILENSH